MHKFDLHAFILEAFYPLSELPNSAFILPPTTLPLHKYILNNFIYIYIYIYSKILMYLSIIGTQYFK